MIERYGQQFEMVHCEVEGKIIRNWRIQLELLERALDGNLPACRDADKLPVHPILNQLLRISRKARIIIEKPEKSVRVEQKVDHMYSSKSGNGSSKSGDIQNFEPFADPARHGHSARSMRDSFATG
jgi:hypothetical protein